MNRPTAVDQSPVTDAPRQRLSPRLTEVWELVALGYTDQAIAGRLYLSPLTVSYYTTRIAEALNIRSERAEGPDRQRHRRVMLSLAWFDRQPDGRSQE